LSDLTVARLYCVVIIPLFIHSVCLTYVVYCVELVYDTIYNTFGLVCCLEQLR